MATFPTREELLKLLEKLRSGEANREEVSAWAMAIIDDDSIQAPDQVAWAVLTNLGSVDLPAPDRDYLYADVDFQDWAAKLRGR